MTSLSVRFVKGIKTLITKRYLGDTDFKRDGLIDFNIMKNDSCIFDVDLGAAKSICY